MKTHLKNILISVLISIFIAILFLVYMKFIGIPKTQARNFYNLAINNLHQGEKEDAIKHLDNALIYWKEDYIIRKLNSLK